MTRRLPLILALAAAAPLATAWNADGHQQIADIAWTRLSPAAKARVGRILIGADGSFAAASKDEAALRDAFRRLSVMPDVIKSGKGSGYVALAEEFNGTWLPNPDPSDREQVLAKTWHYYDVPIRYTGPRPKVSPSNAANAITKARTSLGDLARRDDDGIYASWWLGWIEHITGDLHQPLHTISNYAISPAGDAGGNLIKLGIPGRNGRPLNLHSLWDGAVDLARENDGKNERGGTSFERTTERWIRDAAIQPKAYEVTLKDPMIWINEGVQLATKFVEAPEVRDGYVPTSLYERRRANIGRRAALVAGYRLAEVLNQVLGEQ